VAEEQKQEQKSVKTEDSAGQSQQQEQQQKQGEQRSEDEKKFTQGDIDRIVKERLEREKKKADEMARKAQEDTEAKALAEQQKFKELADKHGEKARGLEAALAARTEELEKANARASRYQQALEAHLKTQTAGLPEYITSLLSKLDPVEQLEYIAANQEKLTSKAGVPPTPKPTGGQLTPEERRKKAYRTRL